MDAEVERLEHEAAQTRASKGWSVLGSKRVRKLSPYKRAKSFEPLRSRNPTFAVRPPSSPQLRLIRDQSVVVVGPGESVPRARHSRSVPPP